MSVYTEFSIVGRVVVIFRYGHLPVFRYREDIYSAIGFASCAFCPDKFSEWIFCAVPLVIAELRAIIIACNIEFIRKPGQIGFNLLVVPARNRSGIIQRVYQVDELPCYFIPFGISLFRDFVTDTPQYYGRMVPVPFYKIRQVFLMPFIPIHVRAVWHCFQFAGCPFVKKFIHDKESHFVANVIKCRIKWIMTGSYGIASHVFKNFQSSFPDAGRDSRTCHSSVMMQTDTF